MKGFARSLGVAAAVGAALLLSRSPFARARPGAIAGSPQVPSRTLDPSFVIAPTFERLEAMIADLEGPKDIALLPQTYRGDLQIGRSVAIHGQDGTVLEGTGSSTVVSVRANDVLIEDVAVRHSGHRQTTDDAGIKAKGERVRIARVNIQDTYFGISLEECRDCSIDRAQIAGYGSDLELRGDGIKLWEAHGSSVRNCIVDHSRDVVVWYTRASILEDNVVRHGRYGTHFMYAHDAIVRRSHLENNVVGIFVMYSKRMKLERNTLAGARGAAGIGLGFKDSDAIEASGNWLVANTAGMYFDNTPRTPADPVRFQGNVVALNDVALRLNGADRGLSFRENEFRQNDQLVEVAGGGTALAVDLRKNHFSDYEGYDLNRDGIGDVAYEVKMLSSELAKTRPAIKFFHGTAAMGLVDTIARAVPVFATKKLLVDPEPLVDAPPIEVP